jgi:hypothetical protein
MFNVDALFASNGGGLTQAHPLAWSTGWPRAGDCQRAPCAMLISVLDIAGKQIP